MQYNINPTILLIEITFENLPSNKLLLLILFFVKNLILEIIKINKLFKFNKIKWYISVTRLAIIIYNPHIYINNKIKYLLLDDNLICKSLKNTLIKIINLLKNNNHYITRITNIYILNNTNIIINLNINNIYSNKYTFSNKICYKPIKIIHPLKYFSTLYKYKINVDYSNRKKIILLNIYKLCKKYKIKININNNFINYLTFLIEWPTISIIKINNKYLKILPLEIFIYVVNNIYKCIYTFKYKKICPYIIIISECLSNNFNIINKNYKLLINNKLLEIIRLINQDKKTKFYHLLPKLKFIILQKKIGNLYDKIMRLKKIIFYIYKFLFINKIMLFNIINFILIFKNDFCTFLVNDIPSFHGIAGMYYSKLEKYKKLSFQFKDYYYYIKNINNSNLINIKCKLYNTYIIVLIDYLDTLIGFILINKNGINFNLKNKDPYGIKKIILIIIKTIIYGNLNFNLNKLITININLYKNIIVDHINDKLILILIKKKYINWLKFFKIPKKIIFSVINNKNSIYYNNLIVIHNIILNINKHYLNNKFNQLISLYKRIKNFINKQKIIVNINTNKFYKINIFYLNKLENKIYLFIKKIYKNYINNINKKFFDNIIYEFYKLNKPINKWINSTFIINNNIIYSKNRIFLLINIKFILLKFINFDNII